MTAIRVKNLKKKYGNFEALKGISFEVKKGEIVGFLGPNGAGKTTTMKILTCFMSANSGEAHIAGYDCLKKPIEVKKRIGYLPENNSLYSDMRIYEYLEYIAELHDWPVKDVIERIKQVVKDCGLSEKVNESISSLSKGYRQRVGLAAALIHDPEILILDEPTIGLDPIQIIEMRNLIKSLGKEKTIILCSHRLAEVELTCNRIIIIDYGEIVASGTPVELRNLVEGYANLKIAIRGDQKMSMNLLEKIPGVKEVHPFTVREKGAHGFGLVTAKNRDPRADIAKAVVGQELQLLEMHRKNASLEKIFNQVTQQQND